MKKAIGYLLLFLVIFCGCNQTLFASTKYFTVTAYYSPLPNQRFYLKGNYNAERILNGMGIKGASGVPVFSGMLAAPKKYKFGTKIYLEGLGIGDIQDRGGAIVGAGRRGYKYDRIDVWMGHGDEGLRRALAWGKRTVPGYIVPRNKDTTIDIKNTVTDSWVENKLLLQQYLFDTSVGLYSAVDDVKKVQEGLKNMGLYKGEIDGNYKKIMGIIYDYQVKNGIVAGEYSLGAGYTGPKTREQLKKDYYDYVEKKIFEEKRKKFLEDKFDKLQMSSSYKASIEVSQLGNPKFGEVSYRVRKLQRVLKGLGYFNHKDTAIFGEVTKASIIAYQIDKKIIQDADEIGAGYMGNRTRAAIKNDLHKRILQDLLAKESDITVSELVEFGIYNI